MKVLKPLFLAGILAFATSANAFVIFENFTLTPFDTHIELRWETTTEAENSHFLVERSFNGTDWFLLTEVPGADVNFNDSTVFYGHADMSPLPGENHYRITAVDNFGNEQLHEYVLFFDYTTMTVCDFIVYPNPADDYLLMYFEDCPPAQWTVQIVSYNGFSMMGQPLDYQAFLQLDVSGLPSGNYLVIVSRPGIKTDIKKQVYIN